MTEDAEQNQKKDNTSKEEEVKSEWKKEEEKRIAADIARRKVLGRKGVTQGIGSSIFVGYFFLILDSASPLSKQFSSDNIFLFALLLMAAGFFFFGPEQPKRRQPIGFDQQWGYLIGGVPVGLLFFLFNRYASFGSVVFECALVFGAWLRLVVMQNKRSLGL